jgi:hypothetical protein
VPTLKQKLSILNDQCQVFFGKSIGNVMLFPIWSMMFYSRKFILDSDFQCHCPIRFHLMISISSFFFPSSTQKFLIVQKKEENGSVNPESRTGSFVFLLIWHRCIASNLRTWNCPLPYWEIRRVFLNISTTFWNLTCFIFLYCLFVCGWGALYV